MLPGYLAPGGRPHAADKFSDEMTGSET